jgi:hypothetical protein
MTLWCPKCRRLWEDKGFQNNQPLLVWDFWKAGVRCSCGAGWERVVWVTDVEALRKLEQLP